MNNDSLGSMNDTSTRDKDDDDAAPFLYSAPPVDNNNVLADVAESSAPSSKTATATSTAYFGAYFAILPALPSIPTSQLLQVCQELCQEQFPTVKWLYHRTSQLNHPQLTEPLPFLEISGKVLDESTCHEIVHALTSRSNSSGVIGNAELLLVLADTLIPILDTTLPLIRMMEPAGCTSASTSTSNMIARAKDYLETHGVVGISPAVRRQQQQQQDNDNVNNDGIWDELLDYTMNVFERLYTQLQTKPKLKQRHYKEIMQRDEHRFDFRLDLITSNSSNIRDDEDSSDDPCCCWERLERTSYWMDLVHDILGSDAVRVKTGCVLSLPGAGEQYWHADGVHVGPTAATAAATFEQSSSSSSLVKEQQEQCECATAASPPYAICVFVPLVTLTMQTGYTEFWSGSHKFDKLLSKKGEQALPGGTFGCLDVGDALLYDYRVVHRGMPNQSNDARPICYYLYAKPGYETIEDQNFTEESVWND